MASGYSFLTSGHSLIALSHFWMASGQSFMAFYHSGMAVSRSWVSICQNGVACTHTLMAPCYYLKALSQTSMSSWHSFMATPQNFMVWSHKWRTFVLPKRVVRASPWVKPSLLFTGDYRSITSLLLSIFWRTRPFLRRCWPNLELCPCFVLRRYILRGQPQGHHCQ